jgi:transposase
VSRFQEIKWLAGEGHSLREVARRTGLARNTVLRLAHCEQFPEMAARPPRKSKLAPFTNLLRQRWNEERRLQQRDATACRDHLQNWREKPRRRVPPGQQPSPRVLTPRQCSWLLTNPEHPHVTDEQRDCLRRLTDRCPVIATAQELALVFCRLVRERGGASAFAAWLARVVRSEVAELKAFARTLEQDRQAVEAGLSLAWSNGQVEGQVNRLKFLKRQMYGRAGFDLLRVRVLPSRAGVPATAGAAA